jgi:hypothetical protein
MLNDTNFKNRIKDILALCQRANSFTSHWGSDSQKAADINFWNAIQALDQEAKQAGNGPQIGRMIKFPQADGYARYIITGVTKKTCKVVHIPYMDGYHSPAVSRDGECWRDQVERIFDWEDSLAVEVQRQNHWRKTAEQIDLDLHKRRFENR